MYKVIEFVVFEIARALFCVLAITAFCITGIIIYGN